MYKEKNDVGTFICDICGEEQLVGTYKPFPCIVEDIEADGWEIKRVNGHWEHHCPECVNK
jgi:hypothetical protein